MGQANSPERSVNTLMGVRSLADAAVATDQNDRILAWNDAMAKLVGIPSIRALAKPLLAVLAARDVFGNPLCCCFVHEAVRRNEPVRAFEMVAHPREEPLRLVVEVEAVAGPTSSRTLIYRFHPERRRHQDRRRFHSPAVADGMPPIPGPAQLRSLTARELEVFRLLERGASTPQVAERLGISVATVRNHSQHILRKLGAHTRLEAVSLVRRQPLS